MKRRLILAALVMGVGVLLWVFFASPAPAPITVQFAGRTNYPNGFTGCLIAITNISTNRLTVLVPMDLATRGRIKQASGPTNVFFCPVPVPALDGKVVPFLQTEAQQRKLLIHFGRSRDFSGFAYRLRRWLRLPRGQPRDFLTSPQTLVLDLPPE